LARGLDYYTGVIYEAIVAASAPPGFNTADALSASSNSSQPSEPSITDPASELVSKATEKKAKKAKPTANGEEDEIDESQVGVGSIAAGGRYDNLVAMFTSAASGETKKGKAPAGLPCVGVAIGLDRVFAVVWPRWVEKGMRSKELMAFVMAAGDGLLEERIRLVCELREAGIKVRASSNSHLALSIHDSLIRSDRRIFCRRTNQSFPHSSPPANAMKFRLPLSLVGMSSRRALSPSKSSAGSSSTVRKSKSRMTIRGRR
jgi:histidyl-tRNA synthetase